MPQTKFAQSFQLKIHMKVHTGQKPHVCKLCKKASAQLAYLKKHILCIHITSMPEMTETLTTKPEEESNENDSGTDSGEDDGEVDEAGVEDKDIDLVMSQANVSRTKADIFQCNECGKWFDPPHNLKRPKQSHLSKDKVSCAKCDKTFPYELALKKQDYRAAAEELGIKFYTLRSTVHPLTFLIIPTMSCPATNITGFNKSKEDFIWFIKKATNDKKSDAHAELYHRLLKMFVDTDTKKDAPEKSAGLFKPSLIDAGFSCYSRNPDYQRVKGIADRNKSWLMADMAAGDVPFSFE